MSLVDQATGAASSAEAFLNKVGSSATRADGVVGELTQAVANAGLDKMLTPQFGGSLRSLPELGDLIAKIAQGAG